MSAADRFFDTNILFYLLSGDVAKAERAEKQLAGGGVVSVQVLNEFASVAARKLKMSIAEIREFLAAIRAVCSVVPINDETHDTGMEVVERYGFAIYDSMIIASALSAGCREVVSEDMQDGKIIEERLQIRNPFR
jgi:predicted nucleic acid-binding protein